MGCEVGVYWRCFEEVFELGVNEYGFIVYLVWVI